MRVIITESMIVDAFSGFAAGETMRDSALRLHVSYRRLREAMRLADPTRYAALARRNHRVGAKRGAQASAHTGGVMRFPGSRRPGPLAPGMLPFLQARRNPQGKHARQDAMLLADVLARHPVRAMRAGGFSDEELERIRVRLELRGSHANQRLHLASGRSGDSSG